MKAAHITFLFFLIFKWGIAQEIAIDTAGTSKVLNDYELNDKQFGDWKSAQSVWNNNEYDQVKQERGIKLDCKSCTSFYLDVIIKVNGSGKMEYYKPIGSKVCGRGITKAEEIRMMRMFFKFEFAPSLRNTIFKTRLGTSLKC